MKLVSNTASPFGRKVGITLAEKGIAYELIEDIPWVEGTVVPQYNPLEQLPILITDEGETVYESSYIPEWLERHYPEPALMPTEINDIDRARKLQVLAEGLMAAVAQVFFEVQREQPSTAWQTRQQRKVIGAIREIARLMEGREFAVGQALSLADIALASTLEFLDFSRDTYGLTALPGAPWREQYPDLARYLDQISERPAFRDSRPVAVEVDPESFVS